MKAWSIFMHSVRQITANFGKALSISSPLLALIALSLFVFWDFLLMDASQLQVAIKSGVVVVSPALVVSLIVAQLLIFLWIAVAWHRFVLLNERSGLIPPFHGSRMAAYVGKYLLISLVMFLPVAITIMLMFSVVGVLTNSLAMSAGMLFLGALLVFIPAGAVFLRLMVILPGAAVAEPTSISHAWNVTRGEMKTFLLLMLIFCALGLVEAGLRFALFDRSTALSVVWQIVATWLYMMLGLSLLTTLYGHYVQRRSLV